MAVISAKEYKGTRDVKPESPLSIPEPVVEDLQGVPRRKKPKPSDPWFILEHPDTSPGNLISCTFDMPLEWGMEKVTIERGRVETQVVEVRDGLIQRGYRFMNEEF